MCPVVYKTGSFVLYQTQIIPCLVTLLHYTDTPHLLVRELDRVSNHTLWGRDREREREKEGGREMEGEREGVGTISSYW